MVICRQALLLAFMATSGMAVKAASPQAAATVPIARITGSDVTPEDASPVFLSDDNVAVLAQFGAPRTGTVQLVVLRLIGSQLQVTAQTEQADESNRLYAVAGNRLLLTSRFHKYLYSPDLKERIEIPSRILSGMFPRGGVIGEIEQGTWKVFRLSSPMAVVREGTGELLSVSDDAIVFRQTDAGKTTSMDGRLLGTVSASPHTRGTHVAEIAGKNRLLVSNGGPVYISDFNGKQLQRIQPPEGWGFRHGWSSDGTRMLFDHFTRTVSALERAVEKVADGIGLAIPEESNGETIRIIDSLTGKVCVNLESPGKLMGRVGSYHADLSPSGRLVAISTPKELSIYSVPKVCSE